MINKMFDEKVKTLGLKFQYIANHLGISVQALRLKRIGRNQFTAKEIKKTMCFIKFDRKRKREIFFLNNVYFLVNKKNLSKSLATN